MYLRKLSIENVKCFEKLEIDFVGPNGEVNPWTTLFGQNGLGKSTLLQAIGCVLAGPSAIRELLPVAENWVRKGYPYGVINAEVMWTEGDSLTPIAQGGRPKTKSPYVAQYIVTGNEPELLPESITEIHYPTVPTIIPWSGEGTAKQRGDVTKDIKRLQQTAYAEGKDGWLACGYGPFRRLSGGGQQADRILYAERISSRFITLFREDAALTNTTDWLIRLHTTGIEGDRNSQSALECVKQAFASRLLPEPAELIVDARSVRLQIKNRLPEPIDALSDGYRSMLALTIDLLRWLINAFPDAGNPMDCHGVVLIDELDAHLHPSWQRQIGHWLREKFPNIQFIVATHSPFLAQVADVDDKGLVTNSNAQHISGNIVLEETESGVQAVRPHSVSTDLRADQILMSPLFELPSLYSPKTEQKLVRHQELFQKRNNEELTQNEEQELEQLSLWREDLELTTSPVDRSEEVRLRQLIHNHHSLFLDLE